MGCPRFLRNPGKITDNASSSLATPFLTLISAKNAQFADPFQPHPPRPAAGYYPKFGFLAEISFRKGAAWDFDGRPAISVKILMMSRGAWLVFEMRKVADWESIGPGSWPEKGGELGGYCMRKMHCSYTCTHSR